MTLKKVINQQAFQICNNKPVHLTYLSLKRQRYRRDSSSAVPGGRYVTITIVLIIINVAV